MYALLSMIGGLVVSVALHPHRARLVQLVDEDLTLSALHTPLVVLCADKCLLKVQEDHLLRNA